MIAAASLLALLWLAAAPPADGLTPQERIGRKIYFDGESPSGAEIVARVGAEGTAVPSTAVTCANCHGDDGLGRPEGAVVPSEVTWSRLTTPYGVTHPNGRKHPAYDERSMARAISDGVDPAGNTLDGSMPRYSMPAEDLKALVAFMKRLESHFDPGVSLANVRLGSVVPGRGKLADVGQAIRGILEAWARDANSTGGIHGRKILLEFAEYDSDAGDGLPEARALLEGGRVAALVSGFMPAGEKELAALVERDKVPFVGPHTPFTPGPGAQGTHVFYVLGGAREQARALSEHAVKGLKLGKGRIAVVHETGEGPAEAARAARAHLAARGAGRVDLEPFAPGALDPRLAARLQARGTRAVLFLGSDPDLAAFTRAAGTAAYAPYLLVPGALASRAVLEAPPAFQGRAFVAYPAIPSDEKPAALERLARLRRLAGLGERNRAAQVSAYAAAAVISEGLRRTGKNLSRERLLRSLGGIVEWDTGLTPAVTFGPARRVATSGAHVVSVDLARRAFTSVGWIALD